MSKWPSSRTGFVLASGKIDLEVVAEVVGADECGRFRRCFEFVRQGCAHAVGGGLVVAGRFDLDEFADRLDEGGLAGFEVVQAFEPNAVRSFSGFARTVLSSHDLRQSTKSPTSRAPSEREMGALAVQYNLHAV